MKHCYALIDPRNNSIVQTTELRDTPPANCPPLIWQQVADDAPAHNPDIHERCNPKFEMRTDGRVYRVFQIRGRSNG